MTAAMTPATAISVAPGAYISLLCTDGEYLAQLGGGSARAEGGSVVSPRTGPVGRVARLAWAIVFVLTLASIVDARWSARFRDPHVLGEPSAWILHVLMLVVFVVLVGAIARSIGSRNAGRVQVIAVIAIAAIAVVAGAVGQLTRGSVWGFPLADAVWTFDVAMAAQELVAFVLAIVLGTPGCEMGVWAEILARARIGSAVETSPLACVVGLVQIDRWEAARRGVHPTR